MTTQLGSTAEAARALNIGTEAFRKRHARGRLPFRPVGDLAGRLMWDLAEVQRHREEVTA